MTQTFLIIYRVDYRPGEYYYILMEYGLCNLDNYIQAFKEKDQHLDPSELTFVKSQILNQIEKLKSIRIYHRDLKPSNIVILEDGAKIKLIDFDLAFLAIDNSDFQLVYPCGTPGWLHDDLQKYYNEEEGEFQSVQINLNLYEIDLWVVDRIIEYISSPLNREISSDRATLSTQLDNSTHQSIKAPNFQYLKILNWPEEDINKRIVELYWRAKHEECQNLIEAELERLDAIQDRKTINMLYEDEKLLRLRQTHLYFVKGIVC